MNLYLLGLLSSGWLYDLKTFGERDGTVEVRH